ncbi:MAG: hypothetical protein ACTHJM_10100 [Marmoricola sp.]
MSFSSRKRSLAAAAVAALGCTTLTVSLASGAAVAAAPPKVMPGDLLVSHLHYTGTTSPIVPGQTVLPTGVTAIAGSDFAHVWDNDTVDGNFGVTAPIYLDQRTPSGTLVNSFAVPTGTPGSNGRGHDVLTGSFSSKSEGALNLSTGGSAVTFMGYVSAPGTLDASNGNTPGVIDPTNPDAQQVYRGVGEFDANGKFWVTQTNAYSGDNGRAAILDEATHHYFMAGNSNNGEGTSLAGLIYGTGAQMTTPQYLTEDLQNTGQPTPAGGFSVKQLPGITKADKLGKDTNFNAVGIHDNVVYYAKGSGGNGVDTLYFIDTTGVACPNGVGLPAANAMLPTQADIYDATTGEPGHNMCILQGFPTGLAKNLPKLTDTGAVTNSAAFEGFWFANDHTLYVADAGNGSGTYDATTNMYTNAAAQNLAGIQKWTLGANGWTYDYTLQSGLGLGVPYAADGLPTGMNSVSGLPWAVAVDGIRQLTGKVNADGSVTLFGVTSAVGGVTDPGANPNKLVSITDQPGATTTQGQSFTTLATAGAGDVYRGVAFAPGS